ncbi:MAG TPA: glycosyltransferase [Bacteroidales bacterium]|nr:glycosyltransferase [Bacteroidales bacterium]
MNNILDKITLLTCTFNNNLLTTMMIKSLFKQIKRTIPVVIIDNGTKEACTDDMKDIFTVIDNTNFKILKNQNQVSRNHCYSIDYALKNCIKTKYVLLCDNDILFKSNLLDFFNKLTTFDAVGEISNDIKQRFLPYFCIIDIEKFKNDNLNYYDPNRCMNHVITIYNKNFEYVTRRVLNNKPVYDTGASFYYDIKSKNWNITKIKLDKYIVHLGSTTWCKKDYVKWLSIHKDLI